MPWPNTNNNLTSHSIHHFSPRLLSRRATWKKSVASAHKAKPLQGDRLLSLAEKDKLLWVSFCHRWAQEKAGPGEGPCRAFSLPATTRVVFKDVGSSGQLVKRDKIKKDSGLGHWISVALQESPHHDPQQAANMLLIIIHELDNFKDISTYAGACCTNAGRNRFCSTMSL